MRKEARTILNSTSGEHDLSSCSWWQFATRSKFQ